MRFVGGHLRQKHKESAGTLLASELPEDMTEEESGLAGLSPYVSPPDRLEQFERLQ